MATLVAAKLKLSFVMEDRRMVSTRSVKVKYFEGERILCYEPDPIKTKVLYDSKVLEIKSMKDESGRSVTQYLIHFQGWNSTWDRFVTEDFILKDTEENRKLQKELAAKAQLTAGGGNLYRLEKKRKTGVGPRTRDSLKNAIDVDKVELNGSVSGKRTSRTASLITTDEKSEDEAQTSIKPLKINLILQADYCNIKEENKLTKLPCQIPAIEILEQWMREYTLSKIRLMCYKKGHLARVVKSPSMTFADSVRVCFDLNIQSILYPEEESQYYSYMPCKQDDTKAPMDIAKASTSKSNNTTANGLELKKETAVLIKDSISPCKEILDKDKKCKDIKDNKINKATESKNEDDSRRKSLRPRGTAGEAIPSPVIPETKVEDEPNGDVIQAQKRLRGKTRSSHAGPSMYPNTGISLAELLGPDANKNCELMLRPLEEDDILLLKKLVKLKLLPEYFHEVLPSMIYGAPQLTRMLVKLQHFILQDEEDENRLQVFTELFNHFKTFLEEHDEWFSSDIYTDEVIINPIDIVSSLEQIKRKFNIEPKCVKPTSTPFPI